MIKENLDREWDFRLIGGLVKDNELYEMSKVDLPHDFSIIQKRTPNTLAGAGNAYYPGGVALYEKKIYIPKTWCNQKVILEFEGVYMNATIHINHNLVMQHPYGYTSFHCDLTPYLLFDKENIISVHVNNNALPNTRWYSGSGIYRHVWLLRAEKLHISPWGVFVTSKVIESKKAILTVETELENDNKINKCIELISAIYDVEGRKVTEQLSNINMSMKNTTKCTQEISVDNVNLWCTENPYLYTVISTIYDNGSIVDVKETRIGIRSITFDAKKGFQLNGATLKLKGGCVHHDCGILGAASYDRAEERKVELLKASGYNSIRCAHNPPSPAFLDACDKHGMLVIDEAFDCWRESKCPNDYSVFFEQWWQKDIESMVLRDRNHPSIIMWSTGNEIVERDGRSEGYKYAKMLADFIRNLDPTRAINNAIHNIGEDPLLSGLEANIVKVNTDDVDDIWGERSYPFAEPLDVVGYNYLLPRYEMDGHKYPDRIICGTETIPKEAFDAWEKVKQLSYVIGDFVWTGIDYLGEAGIGYVRYNGETGFTSDYPWHTAYCGDIDICGFKRPQSFYRDCIWDIAKKPYISVHKPQFNKMKADISPWGWDDVISSWTWPGYVGELITVDIYSSCSEVELFLNGNSLGRKPSGIENRYITTYKVIYEPGILTCIGYSTNKGIEESRLFTAAQPTSLRITPDRNNILAKFGDISFITVEVVDNNNNLVPSADHDITYHVEGCGEIIAVGNSNPISEEMYIGNQRKVFEGRAIVVVRSTGTVGQIKITATSSELGSETVTINCTLLHYMEVN